MKDIDRSVISIRVWLPKQLCAVPHEDGRLAMVGWVSEGLDFLDVVVAAGVRMSEDFSADVTKLQRCLAFVELKLPAKLRTERKLCVVGVCVFIGDGIEEDFIREVDVIVESKNLQQYDNIISPNVANTGNVSRAWALFLGYSCCGKGKKLDCAPNTYCIIRDNCYVAPLNTQIITYNQPQFGSHHYSSLPWSSSPKKTDSRASGKEEAREPMWLSAMEKHKTALNMEMIMMKLNCARFIARSVQEDLTASGQYNMKPAVHLVNCRADPWRPLAILVTVWATLLYCLARSLDPVLSVWLPAVPFLRNVMQKSTLLQIMHIRSQQLMAWPFMLLWGGLGPKQPNVANANRVAISKHSTWFSLLIDKIAGAIVGFLVLKHHTTVLTSLVDSGRSLTNDVLRTGCVWLMGIPAGFKINTELAALFGTLSLHWIQAWSTLLFTSIPAISMLLLVLGLSGIVMGFTVFAAMVSDMVAFSTIHVLSLREAIAFIYSNQLRALAALFRLFRGRKRNVLRGRLDSFECSVEQLLVGSLMFTPLLLLLPTTSVFYTFFSIIFLTVSSIQLSIHYVISILLLFPFCEVASWFLRPKQFPSGLWMRMVQAEKSLIKTPTYSKVPTVGKGFQNDVCDTNIRTERLKAAVSDQRFTGNLFSKMGTTGYSSRSGPSRVIAEVYGSYRIKNGEERSVLTMLEVRTASFGELLRPFLETHYSGLQWPSVATVAYKVVSGERFDRELRFGDFNQLPHTALSAKSFAQVTYTAIMG